MLALSYYAVWAVGECAEELCREAAVPFGAPQQCSSIHELGGEELLYGTVDVEDLNGT